MTASPAPPAASEALVASADVALPPPSTSDRALGIPSGEPAVPVPEQDYRGELADLARKFLGDDAESHELAVVAIRRVSFSGVARVVAALRIDKTCFVFGVIDPITHASRVLPSRFYCDCKGMDLLSEEDINGDGVPDFQFHVVVHSNRYEVYVNEGAIYLSDASNRGYCYADSLATTVPTSRNGALSRHSWAESTRPSAFHCDAGR
jgi:hypothetical protein